jgi:GxxExxY protein
MEPTKTYSEPDKRTDELAHAVIGAAIEVHRHLGPGFLESTYEEALSYELQLRCIPFERQKELNLSYKGRALGKNRLDFLIGESLLLELKAVEALGDIHKAQVISYLKAIGKNLGLLINFNVPVLRDGIQRVVHSNNYSSAPSWRLGG